LVYPFIALSVLLGKDSSRQVLGKQAVGKTQRYVTSWTINRNIGDTGL